MRGAHAVRAVLLIISCCVWLGGAAGQEAEVRSGDARSLVEHEAATRGLQAHAASLLRHVPAEATLFGSRPIEAPGAERSNYLQVLTDLREVALGQQGLRVNTQEVSGDPEAQLEQQLATLPDSMLVLGVSTPAEFAYERLTRLLEGQLAHPVLIVRPFALDVAPVT